MRKRRKRETKAAVSAICTHSEEHTMSRHITLGLAMIAGAALGAAAVQTLHAQAKPPIYQITEIDVSNLDAYLREYAPKAQALIKASGGRSLAAGQNVTRVEGDAPKARVALTAWDSMEKFQAYRNLAEFKELRATIGDKYAKFRSFTVEGVAQ
jgi:uncharacterized protein (DUF1330 family)